MYQKKWPKLSRLSTCLPFEISCFCKARGVAQHSWERAPGPTPRLAPHRRKRITRPDLFANEAYHFVPREAAAWRGDRRPGAVGRLATLGTAAGVAALDQHQLLRGRGLLGPIDLYPTAIDQRGPAERPKLGIPSGWGKTEAEASSPLPRPADRP